MEETIPPKSLQHSTLGRESNAKNALLQDEKKGKNTTLASTAAAQENSNMQITYEKLEGAGSGEGKKVSPKKFRRQVRNTEEKLKGLWGREEAAKDEELGGVDGGGGRGEIPKQKKARGEGSAEATNKIYAGLSEQPCESK